MERERDREIERQRDTETERHRDRERVRFVTCQRSQPVAFLCSSRDL